MCILAVVVVRSRGVTFDWKLFVRTLYQLDWGSLAVSMLLMLLTYVFRAFRWQVMLRPTGRDPGIRKLTSDTVIGFTAATFLGRVGEIVRPYLISVSAGVSFSSQMASWLLERVLDLMSILLLFAMALLLASPRREAAGSELGWVLNVGGYLAAFIGILCLILLVVFRNFSDFAQQRILGALRALPVKYYEHSRKLITALARGLESTRDPRLLGLLAWYTLLLWGAVVGSYYFLFHAFPFLVHLSVTDAVCILGFMGFGSLVQLPGVGGGMQVVCILCLTKLYGVPFEAASGVAIFISFLMLLVVAPIGMLCALHEGWNWPKIKRLAVEQAPKEEFL